MVKSHNNSLQKGNTKQGNKRRKVNSWTSQSAVGKSPLKYKEYHGTYDKDYNSLEDLYKTRSSSVQDIRSSERLYNQASHTDKQWADKRQSVQQNMAIKQNFTKDFLQNKTLSDLVQLFCEETTSHGPGHWWNNRNNFLGIFWGFATVLCAICLMIPVTSLLIDFAQRDIKSQTLIEKSLESGLQYPSTTICNRAVFSNKKIKNFGFSPTTTSYLILQATSPLFGNVKFLSTPEGGAVLNNAHYNLTSTMTRHSLTLPDIINRISLSCEDVILFCIIEGIEHAGSVCCQSFVPVQTLNGLCFTYFSRPHEKQRIVGEYMGANIYVKANDDDIPEIDQRIIEAKKIPRRSIILSVSSNLTDPSTSSLSDYISIIPGHIVSAAVSQTTLNHENIKTTIDITDRPCKSASGLDYAKNLTDFLLTKDNCYIAIVQSCISKICDCDLYTTFDKDSSNICGPERLTRCYPLGFAALMDSDNTSLSIRSDPIYRESADCIKRITSQCDNICEDSYYKISQSQYKMTEESLKQLAADINQSDNWSKLALVSIYFPKLEYTKVIFSRTTFSDMLSSLGGFMGLFIGVSIITTIEVIVFIILCLVQCCRHACGRQQSDKTYPIVDKKY